MMARDLFKVEGYQEFVKAVKTLDDKMKKREIVKIWRRVAKPTLTAAKQKVPVKSGRLKRSLGLVTGKSKTYINVLVIARRKGQYRGNHAHLVEYGHIIRHPKTGRIIGHAPPQPFMRPAWDQTKTAATANTEKLLAKHIEKTIQKLLK